MSWDGKRERDKPYLDLLPEDYAILEAAAVTTLNRMGLRGQWSVEDLISHAWFTVFWYFKSHADFKRFGYLHCLRAMYHHVVAEQQQRARERKRLQRYAAQYPHDESRESEPGATVDAQVLLDQLDRRSRALVMSVLWRKRSERSIGRSRDVSGQAIGKRYETILRRLRQAAG